MRQLYYFIAFLSLLFTIEISNAQLIIFNDSLYDSALNSRLKYSDSLMFHNSNLPNDFQEAFKIAFSYFPDLNSSQIDIKVRKIKTSMATRPKLSCLFKNAGHREYILFINDDTTSKANGVLLEQLCLFAQIGIISHELSHITQYKSQSKFSLFFNGAGYILFPFYKKKVEHRTDELTIANGLGLFLYKFNTDLHSIPGISERYLKYKDKFYYSPSDLINIMQLYPEIYPELH